MSVSWKLFISKAFQLRKNRQFFPEFIFDQNVSTEFRCLFMVRQEVIFSRSFSINLYVKKKWKIDFYSCKEIVIRSGYWKLFLNQGYMLLVINMNLYVSVFQFLPDSSTYCELKSLAISPQRMTLLVKIMLTTVEKSFSH